MDPLLRQFHRQYLQQVTNLTYPPSKLLAHSDIQQQLYRYFFDDSVDKYLPPPQYQRRVLKRVVTDLLRETKDEDDELSDELMAHMGLLSSLPEDSESNLVQPPRVLSYFVPDQPALDIDTSTFDESTEAHDQNHSRILIRESPQLLAAGSNVGLRTWEACLRLAYYLCTSPSRSSMRKANVLELGAGTGLLSLICSMSLDAGYVLATDGLSRVVEGIEDNIALNMTASSSEQGRPNMPVARILDWTDLSDLNEVLLIDKQTVQFDYILGADITYHPELLGPLANLVSKLKDQFPKARVLISATIRNENTVHLWRQTCNDHHLVIREINKEEDQWQCPPYRLQTGLFHDQAFPTVIMDITKRTKNDP